MRYVYVLLIGILFNACGNKPLGNNGKMVDMDTVRIQKKEYVSSFYKKVNVIVLDTMDVLLKDIVKLQVRDSILFVMDETENIYAFTDKGRFIYSIGSKGSGPGEYVSPTDFAIDPVLHHIYVLDFALQAINIYSMDGGKYVASLKLDDTDYRIRHIHYSGGNLYVDLYPKESGDYLIGLLDLSNGKVCKYYGDVNKQNRGWKRIAGKSPFYESVDGGVYFIPSFSEGIYKLTNEELKPVLTLCGKSMMDLETFKSINFDNENEIRRIVESNKIFNIGKLIDRGTTMMFNYIQGNVSTFVCATNDMSSLTRLQVIFEDLIFKKEDNVYLDSRFACLGTVNKRVYYYLNTFGMIDFIDRVKGGYLSPTLENYSQLREISEDSNPLIICYEY